MGYLFQNPSPLALRLYHTSGCPLTLKGVVFHTAESGGCLLHFGTGDQTIPAEKAQQGRKDSTLHQAKKMCYDVTGGKCMQLIPPLNTHQVTGGARPDTNWGNSGAKGRGAVSLLKQSTGICRAVMRWNGA